MKTTILIDGDVIIYQQALAAEEAVDFNGDGMLINWCDSEYAKQKVDIKIAEFVQDLEADEVIVALSCPTEDGFRRGLNPTYKSNRSGKQKPLAHAVLRQHLMDNYGAILRSKLEADDLLGILSTEKTPGEKRIVVSIDKDFKAVPCYFYNFQKPEEGVTKSTIKQAAHFHAIQTLAGDAVDGYSGCPKVGPVSAERILDGLEVKDYWEAIVAAYKKAGLTEDEAILNSRMAYILQAKDYNKKTGKVKLWKPSSKWQNHSFDSNKLRMS